MNIRRFETQSFSNNCLILFDIPSENKDILLKLYLKNLIELIEFLKLKNITIHLLPINKNIIEGKQELSLTPIKEILLKEFPIEILEEPETIQNHLNQKDSIFLLSPGLYDWKTLSKIKYEAIIIDSYQFLIYTSEYSNFSRKEKQKFSLSTNLFDSISILEQFSSSTIKGKTGIFGGNQVQKTIDFLEKNARIFHYLLLGGNVGITAIKSNGVNVGNSPYSKEELSSMFQMIHKARFEECQVEFPIDHIAAEKISPKTRVKNFPREIKEPYIGIDLGSKTIQTFENIIKQSNLILMHGPLGIIELEKGKKATLQILKILQKIKKPVIISGHQLCEFAFHSKMDLKSIPDFNFITGFLNQNLKGLQLFS